MKQAFKIEYNGKIEFTNNLVWINEKIRKNTIITITETKYDNIIFSGKRMEF